MKRPSPESLLQDRSSQAQVLTITDKHMAILVTRGEDRSLFQLTLQPFHRESLPRSGSTNQEDSQKVLEFLSQYDFLLTSESGAEYSYYNARPKMDLWTTMAHKLRSFISQGYPQTTALGPLQSVLVSPASDRQIQRASPSPAMSLIQETPEIYEKVCKPYIQSIRDSASLSWIDNILSGEKEKERALLDHKDFLLNIDTKWRSHPDPKTTSQEEWYNHESAEDLYCLAILKDGNISSLRDFRKEHISILRSILAKCPPVIQQVYGVPRDQLRIFIHYQPQFYHAHIHFTRLQNEGGAQVERGHLVKDVIQNLEMDPDYYTKRVITYKLNVTDPLYRLIQEFEEEE
jgi:m7GpppX diphosphatase